MEGIAVIIKIKLQIFWIIIVFFMENMNIHEYPWLTGYSYLIKENDEFNKYDGYA